MYIVRQPIFLENFEFPDQYQIFLQGQLPLSGKATIFFYELYGLYMGTAATVVTEALSWS